MNLDFANTIAAKTDEELIAIYINPAFYQPEFVWLVREEIHRRQLPLPAIEQIREEKEKAGVAHLAVGRQGSPLYIAICFCLALFGGIPAIISGYIYGFSRHKGPDGNSYFVYNEGTRKMGHAILVVGVAAAFIEWQLR